MVNIRSMANVGQAALVAIDSNQQSTKYVQLRKFLPVFEKLHEKSRTESMLEENVLVPW